MDILWPDRDPAAAANNLHQAVHVARRALDPAAIEVRDEVLTLHAEFDVEVFAPPRSALAGSTSRPHTAARSPSTAATSCRRTATTTGPRAAPRARGAGGLLADELVRLAEHADRPFSVPVDASSFRTRPRARRARRVAPPHAPAHARGTGDRARRGSHSSSPAPPSLVSGGAALVELAASDRIRVGRRGSRARARRAGAAGAGADRRGRRLPRAAHAARCSSTTASISWRRSPRRRGALRAAPT